MTPTNVISARATSQRIGRSKRRRNHHVSRSISANGRGERLAPGLVSEPFAVCNRPRVTRRAPDPSLPFSIGLGTLPDTQVQVRLRRDLGLRGRVPAIDALTPTVAAGVAPLAAHPACGSLGGVGARLGFLIGAAMVVVAVVLAVLPVSVEHGSDRDAYVVVREVKCGSVISPRSHDNRKDRDECHDRRVLAAALSGGLGASGIGAIGFGWLVLRRRRSNRSTSN